MILQEGLLQLEERMGGVNSSSNGLTTEFYNSAQRLG